jgi:GNAT superfamily N-acetyltransferase
MPGGTRVITGVEYRRLEPSFDSEALFAFNKEHGSTPLNFIPDDAVRAHLSRIATGETIVWAAFCEGELAGFISGEKGGGYWMQTGAGEEPCCFINEFVVAPKWRGKRIGVNLTTLSVDLEMGIWAQDPSIKEMYTTVHVDNIASRTAFVKGGYRECITYRDAMRDRNTTVLKMSSVRFYDVASQLSLIGASSSFARPLARPPARSRHLLLLTPQHAVVLAATAG